MREWLVGGAVIEAESLGETRSSDCSGLLLVENLRPGGVRDWTTPGGVIDPGEPVREGLGREVLEETGLSVVSWSDLLYEVRVDAPDLNWSLRVEVHRAEVVSGAVAVGQDPDGIVVDADWHHVESCCERLSSAPPWVAEPLLEWVRERFDSPRAYGFVLHGTRLSEFRVHRKDPLG